MGRYALKTQDGEIINSIKANYLYEACELFAEAKKLSVDDLTEIFIVELFDVK